MAKRIIGFILCFALCFMILPFSAYAKEQEAGPAMITSLEITIPEPVAGENPSFSAVVPEDAGYDVEDYDDDEWISGVNWSEEDTYTCGEDYVYELGHDYWVYISLVLTDEQAYRFADADDIRATVNGRVAEVSAYDDNNYVVNCCFTLRDKALMVGKVSVTVPKPAAGEEIPYAASVPDGAIYALEDFDIDGWQNGVIWQDEEGDPLEPGAVFEPGKAYIVIISLVLPDDGHWFAPQDELAAAVNGRTAQAYKYSFDNYGISRTFHINEPNLCDVLVFPDAEATEPVTGSVVERGTVYGAISAPEREDEEFMGWFTDRACTTPYDPAAPVTQDTEIFAKWEKKATRLLGDADGNGVVNVFDASYVQKGLTGTAGYPDYAAVDRRDIGYRASDADGNGVVNIFDAATVQKFLTGSASAQGLGIGELMR